MNEEKVDVTLSVLIDNAVIECHKTLQKITEDLQLPAEIAELAMEKALFEIKNQKARIYATVILSGNEKEKKEGGVDGNTDY